jgi:N-acetylglucosamine-6-phosphate deacetylase
MAAGLSPAHDVLSQAGRPHAINQAAATPPASSVVGMAHMVRQMKRHTSASLPDVIRMASLTPAQRAGIDQDVGSLTVGRRADMLVLSKRLAVKRVVIGGQVWRKQRTSSRVSS